jgi:lipoprotein-releasing system permease protein
MTAAVADTKPFSPFEWLLASRYLRARRSEGFISVIAGFSFLGIMLGVATLIIVMAVMNGFRKDLFSKILGLNGHVVVYRIGEAFQDYEPMAKTLAKVPGIKSAIPLIEGQVMVSSNTNALGGLVRGMSEESLKTLPLVYGDKGGDLDQGTFRGFDSQAGIAVGEKMAAALGVKLGDTITILSAKGASTPFGTAPRSKPYEITAIFKLGMSEYDKSIIFMPLEESQKYFGKRGEVDVLEIVVDDPEQVEAYKAAMLAAAGPTISLSDWRQRNSTFFGVLEVERNVMFIILSLIILVAALNIISGMMMLVKDKGRDIAVLRTMGASKGSIMRVFLITGASIGVVGTLAGLILGLIFCRYIEQIRQAITYVTGKGLFPEDVYYLTKIPAEVNPTETTMIVLMALALSVLATLYPSWRASKLDPVEALRYE